MTDFKKRKWQKRVDQIKNQVRKAEKMHAEKIANFYKEMADLELKIGGDSE